jgi:hypothetical protein
MTTFAPHRDRSSVINPVPSFFALARGLRSARPVRKQATSARSNAPHPSM